MSSLLIFPPLLLEGFASWRDRYFFAGRLHIVPYALSGVTAPNARFLVFSAVPGLLGRNSSGSRAVGCGATCIAEKGRERPYSVVASGRTGVRATAVGVVGGDWV